MPSTFATELFVKLFGEMPPKPGAKKKQKQGTPKTEVLVPNRLAEPGGKVIYHVTPRRKDDRWNIRKEGGSRPSAVCDTKDEAVGRAREIAQNQPWSQVVIHNKNGKIAAEYSYGAAPDGRAVSEEARPDDDWVPDETDRGFDMTEIPTSAEKRPTAKIDKEAPARGREITRRVRRRRRAMAPRARTDPRRHQR